MNDLKNHFRPEFLNRLDETIMFKPLTKANITNIIDLLVKDLNRRLADKELICRSSGRYQAAPKARPRGTMVTLISGLAYSSNQEMLAWPASCIAMERRSASVVILVFFSNPPTIRSTASRKSCFPTNFLPWRAAIKAASLHTLAMSAPENPGVWRARRSTSTLLSILMGRRCTPNTSLRSLRSGRSTCIWRSKRPAAQQCLGPKRPRGWWRPR